VTLRVISVNDHYELDVVSSQQAERNILGNPRRVVYGRVGARDGECYTLKLEGYHRTRCLIDPDVVPEVEVEKLASYDLFRFTRSNEEKTALYFRPLRVSQLKQHDLLYVQYQPPASEQSDRAIVLFGKQYAGYVRQRDISYQVGFNIHTFQPPAERSAFEACIISTQPDSHVVFFSLKGMAPSHLNYFLEHRNDQRFSAVFPATLVGFTSRNDALDVELEPGMIVRLPLCRVSVDHQIGLTAYDLNGKLLPGDVLQFRLLVKQASTVYLCLTGILKSLLHSLHQGMLVHTSLEERRGNSGYQWVFTLPEYGNRRGMLETSSPIDFFPGVFHENLQFVVQHIPADPNTPVRLRQRNNRDAHQVVRVEAIDVDAIHVCKEDGHKADISIRYATYRVDDRISYLACTLQISGVITVTRTTNPKGETIFSLLKNPPAPFAFLAKYIEQRQLESLELTYVRSQGQEHVFELEPGNFILIPATALFFYDCPMQDLQRFLPGDVFSARVQQAARSAVGEVSISIRSVHLWVLHHWQPEQYFYAQVIETYPRSGGIVVKAGPLETFLAEKKGQLLPHHTANTFTKNDALWVKIAQIYPSFGEIRLEETLPPSRKLLMAALGERKRPLLTGKIRSPHAQIRSLQIEVLGEILTLQPHDLVWSDAATVQDVLLPGEKELWVRPFFAGDRLCADAKSFLAPHVSRSLRPGTTVQAYVEKVNSQQAKASGKILLNVDGIRTLVSDRDLVWGLPPACVGVKEGIWLTVCIIQAEQSQLRAGASAPQHLSISGRTLNTELEALSPGSSFQASVRYTLAHGLVFTYKGALGYIANQDLAWSEDACAEELFAEGDLIIVYKVLARASTPPFAFSLKHRSQIDGLKYEETINATIYRLTEKNIYLQTADLPANFFVLFSQRQADFASLRSLRVGDPVLIQLAEGAHVSRLVVPFQLKHAMGDSSLPMDLNEEEIRQSLDRAYEGAVTRFLSLLHDNGLLEQIKQPLAPAGSERLLARILEVLTQCAIPCTYHNLRVLLGKLDRSSALQGFWEVLAHHRLDESDGQMITVLCRVAQGLKRIETRSNPPRALLAQICYAQGITALLPGNAEHISSEEALELLLSAYQHSPHVEIMLALVLIYGKLQAFVRVQEFLDLLVLHFCRNLHMLFHLPEPLDIHSGSYPRLRSMVPGLNMNLDDFAIEMQRTVRDNFAQGKVGVAAEYLKNVIARLRTREIEMPELSLNQALCFLFAGHFAHAQRCLDEVGRMLEKGEEKKRFFRLHLPYAHLKIFLYYQQKNFARIQRFLIEEIEQGFYLWEHTCLPAYLLLAAGNRAASQACMEAVPLRSDSQPERIVLSLYLDRTQQLSAAGLPLLQEGLFGRFYKGASNWERDVTLVQVLPDLASLSQFKDVVRICYEYDVPLYALTRYREQPSLEKSIGDTTVATQMVDLALRSARVEEAQKLAPGYFERREYNYPMEAARFICWFYAGLMLHAELQKFSLTRQKPAWNEIFKQALSELSRSGDLASSDTTRLAHEEYAINRILEHWLKSPYHGRRSGLYFAQLLKKSPLLSAHYWRSPVLRKRLWQVFAGSHDYGTLLEILPGPESITLEMLDDITLHLYLLRLHHRAIKLLRDVQDRADFLQDEKSVSYLQMLRKLGEEEVGPAFDCKLTCLLQRPSKRQRAFSMDCQQRQVAIEALEFLVHSPYEQDLVNMHFLLAELLELERRSEQAGQVYQAVLCSPVPLSPVQYVLAFIRLLRLHALDQSLSWPADLLDERPFQDKEPLYYQLLQDLCTLFQQSPSPQDRTHFIHLLGRLQVTLTALDRGEETRPVSRQLFLAQVEALLYALSMLPRPHRCFVTLYRVLVGTEPLKDWLVEDLLQLFSLFFDAGLLLNFDCDLEETMKATGVHFAALAQSGSRQDQDHYARLECARQELQCVDSWLSHRWLTENPERVEETARIVKGFLHRTERFSEALIDEATLALRAKKDLDLCAGSDSRWLLTRALLAQGEITQALQQIYSERDPDIRDELLLEIFFDRVKSRDFQCIHSFLPHFTSKTLKNVERLLNIWESPDARRGANAHKDLAYLSGHGQRQLAIQYMHMLPDIPLSQLQDEVLYVLLAYADSRGRTEDYTALQDYLATSIAASTSSRRDPSLADWLLEEFALMVAPGG
jgi:hypothetical protein